MSSLNKCQFIGRIGRDPEARFFPDGSPVVNFSVAVDESYKAKDGNKVEKTEWISVQATGPTATFISTYLGKGRLVYVEGKLSTRKFNDKDGNEKYVTEIKAFNVLALDKRPDGAQAAPTPEPAYTGRKDMDELDGPPF